MDNNLAKQLMECFSSLDGPLNEAATLIEQIKDEIELKKFRKSIASIMANIYTELELPIIMQHPEFDPDTK
ncbi:MAG: nuclear receptor NHR-99 [Desulfuromonadales bacterium]|nr:nuclear receptor NHR-99 [Desulfuromonadales bacterium]